MFGIASEEAPELLRAYADDLGLTYPILQDTDGSLLEVYKIERETFSTAYPHDWIVGADGILVYGSNRYDPVEMQRVIEIELER